MKTYSCIAVLLCASLCTLFAMGPIESSENVQFVVESWEDVEALKSSLDSLRIIDTRSESEYENAHIPGAERINYVDIAEELADADRDTPIILYCTSGFRSGIAFNTLVDLGFSNVVNFGGIGRWEGEIATGLDP